MPTKLGNTHTRCQTGEEYSPVTWEDSTAYDILRLYEAGVWEVEELLAEISDGDLKAAVCNIAIAAVTHPEDATAKAFVRQLRAHAGGLK